MESVGVCHSDLFQRICFCRLFTTDSMNLSSLAIASFIQRFRCDCIVWFDRMFEPVNFIEYLIHMLKYFVNVFFSQLLFAFEILRNISVYKWRNLKWYGIHFIIIEHRKLCHIFCSGDKRMRKWHDKRKAHIFHIFFSNNNVLHKFL